MHFVIFIIAIIAIFGTICQSAASSPVTPLDYGLRNNRRKPMFGNGRTIIPASYYPGHQSSPSKGLSPYKILPIVNYDTPTHYFGTPNSEGNYNRPIYGYIRYPNYRKYDDFREATTNPLDDLQKEMLHEDERERIEQGEFPIDRHPTYYEQPVILNRNVNNDERDDDNNDDDDVDDDDYAANYAEDDRDALTNRFLRNLILYNKQIEALNNNAPQNNDYYEEEYLDPIDQNIPEDYYDHQQMPAQQPFRIQPVKLQHDRVQLQRQQQHHYHPDRKKIENNPDYYFNLQKNYDHNHNNNYHNVNNENQYGNTNNKNDQNVINDNVDSHINNNDEDDNVKELKLLALKNNNYYKNDKNNKQLSSNSKNHENNNNNNYNNKYNNNNNNFMTNIRQQQQHSRHNIDQDLYQDDNNNNKNHSYEDNNDDDFDDNIWTHWDKKRSNNNNDNKVKNKNNNNNQKSIDFVFGLKKTFTDRKPTTTLLELNNNNNNNDKQKQIKPIIKQTKDEKHIQLDKTNNNNNINTQNAGQKEIVLPRPANPVRNPFTAPVMEMLQNQQQDQALQGQHDEESRQDQNQQQLTEKRNVTNEKKGTTIYDTINQMMEMEKKLEKYSKNTAKVQKRFVSNEEILVKELDNLKRMST